MTSCGMSERWQHLLGIEPDAHAVLADAEDHHVADAGQARELVAQSWSVAKLLRNSAS